MVSIRIPWATIWGATWFALHYASSALATNSACPPNTGYIQVAIAGDSTTYYVDTGASVSHNGTPVGGGLAKLVTSQDDAGIFATSNSDGGSCTGNTPLITLWCTNCSPPDSASYALGATDDTTPIKPDRIAFVPDNCGNVQHFSYIATWWQPSAAVSSVSNIWFYTSSNNQLKPEWYDEFGDTSPVVPARGRASSASNVFQYLTATTASGSTSTVTYTWVEIV